MRDGHQQKEATDSSDGANPAFVKRDLNALIATCSEYTFLTKGKRVDGTMYSCTSLGTKIGGGLGTAIAGWLLNFSGFDAQAALQSLPA